MHAALPSPDGRLLLVADLGMDRLFRYVVGPAGRSRRTARSRGLRRARAGAAPLAFHPNGAWLYLVAELERSLLVFRSAPAGLQLTATHALRRATDGRYSLAADVHVTPNGRFVYASVRGGLHQAFRVLENGGRLEPMGRFSSGGKVSAQLAISPDGLYARRQIRIGQCDGFPRDAQTARSIAGRRAGAAAGRLRQAGRLDEKKHRNSAEAPQPIEKPRLDPAQQT